MTPSTSFRFTLCAAAVAALIAACGGGGGGGAGGDGGDGGSGGGSPQYDAFPTVTTQSGNPQGNNITGSMAATDANCVVQNGNQFATRQAVYIQESSNGASIPEGYYHVRVTSPKPNGDESLLGAPNVRVYVTSTGALQANPTTPGCVQVWGLVKKANGDTGFDLSPNPGGVYKVWISKDAGFAQNLVRTDNIMVRENTPSLPAATGSITTTKFYDANLDGYDNDALPIAGWLMQIVNATYQSVVTATGLDGSVTFNNLALADYVATERKPQGGSWYAVNAYDTANPQVWPVIGDDQSLNKFQLVLTTAVPNRTIAFGNVCVGPAGGEGGKTLGYWSNKNGESDIAALNDPWGQLAQLHLTDQSGAALNGPFTDHAAFRSWLLSGNAQNMAYMLSVQLAAMKFNVLTGKVSGTAMIRAEGVPVIEGVEMKFNFMTVNDLMKVADKLLEEAPLTVANLPPGMDYRERQAHTKNALDEGNNNRSFLQSTPANCPLTFPSP